MAYPMYGNSQYYMQNLQDKNTLMKIAQKEKENYNYIKQLMGK